MVLKILFVLFWVTPVGAQGSLLALHTRITSGGAQETVDGARDGIGLSYMPGKHIRPSSYFSIPVFVVVAFRSHPIVLLGVSDPNFPHAKFST